MSLHSASRARPALLLLLVVLVCCCLFTSAFEAGRKKTDKDSKQRQPQQAQLHPASVKPSQQTAASISNEGDVSVQPAEAATVTPTAAKVAASAAVEPTLDSVSLQLEHDLSGDGQWQRRGDVDISFSSSASSGSGQRGGGVRFSSEELSGDDRLRLQRLVDSDGFYRVRVNTGTASSPRYVLASVRACALAASALHQHFLFHFDIHGRLLAIQLSTPITACSQPQPAASSPLPAAFTSKAKLSFGRTGEKPANIRLRLQPGEQPSAREGGAAGAEGSKEEEKTFFQKYWIYIVPLGGFMLLQAFMGAMGEKKDGDGGGGGQRASS